MIRPTSLYPFCSTITFVDCYGENPQKGTVIAQNAYSVVVRVGSQAYHLSTSLISDPA